MIYKSSQRGNGGQLTKHLLSDENERVELVEIYGLSAENLTDAVAEMEMIAAGSHAKKPLYHVSVSPHPGERMTTQDWARAWQVHDQIHGLDGLPFVTKGHWKKSRYHQHRIYCRVDPNTGTARNLPWTRLRNERVSRQIEVELDHEIVPGKHNRAVISALQKDGLNEIAEQLAPLLQAAPRVPEYTHSEWQLSKRGAPIDQVRATLAEAWAQADSAKAFEKALIVRGFAVAQGDKVPVAVGLDGQEIPLLRAINAARKKFGESSIRKADLAAMLSEKIPDIDAVRETLAERHHLAARQQDKESNNMSSNASLNPTPEADDTEAKNGRIEEAKADETRRKSQKQQLLEQHYGQEIENSALAKYWKVSRQEDGTLELSNRAGTVRDCGDVIDIETKGGKLRPSVAAALQVSQIKGWDEIRIKGSDEFKREAYRLAIGAGIQVHLDREHDKQLFANVNAKLSEPDKNQIRPVDQPESEPRSGPKMGRKWAENGLASFRADKPWTAGRHRLTTLIHWFPTATAGGDNVSLATTNNVCKVFNTMKNNEKACFLCCLCFN